MRISKSKQTFSLVAPGAQEVLLAGDFTGWEQRAVSLKKGKEELWTATVLLEPGKHEYRFLVDGQWSDDPDCPIRVQNQFGTENCVRIVPDAPKRRSAGK